jgi:hypothetical protein
MELPGYAYGSPPQGVGLSQTMSHFMPTNYRELSEFFYFVLVEFFLCLFFSFFSSFFFCRISRFVFVLELKPHYLHWTNEPFYILFIALLYIHRCFFAHAISSHPLDPIKSQYAPSFLAGYRSACTIIGTLKQQFSLFPAQIARCWVLWTHAFSSAVSIFVACFALYKLL